MKLWVVLLPFLLVACRAKKAPKKGNRDDVQHSVPVDDEDKTLLIKVDYAFETESILYDKVENKRVRYASKTAGNFTFETLHHDFDGTMLAKMTLTSCSTNNCGQVDPVYVAFHQGGNNIIEVFVDAAVDAVNWNPLFAFINAIYTPAEYGEGDEQVVNTVYGKCRTHFGRPEDKRFRRIIDNCNLAPAGARNFTRLQGIEVSSYEQDVWYTQNTKVNADIILIDAIESLELRTPVEPNHGFVMESRIHITIQNRNQSYVKKYCPSETSTSACAVEAFGAKSVGKKLYEEVSFGPSNVKQVSVALANKSEVEVFQAIQAAEEKEIQEFIEKANEDNITRVVNHLGTLGTVESIDVCKKILEARPGLVGPLAIGIASTTASTSKWQKAIVYLLQSKESSPDVFWPLARAFASVLNRKCERKAVSCDEKKDLVIDKFLEIILKTENNLQIMLTLTNLPIKRSFDLAKPLLCSSEPTEVQNSALELIARVDKKLYDSKLYKTLVSVFRNTCELKTATQTSNLALDVLLRALPEAQNVATLLLRSESSFPEDHEKWRYFYEAVNSTSSKNDLTADFWKRMRNFKVFKPNYAQRSLNAHSFSDWRQLGEKAGFKLNLETKGNFCPSLDNFATLEWNLVLKKGRQEINFIGLKSELFGAFSKTITLLGAKYDVSESKKVIVPLRDVSFSFPMLSGLTIQVDSQTIMSVDMNGMDTEIDFESVMSVKMSDHEGVKSYVRSDQTLNADVTVDLTTNKCLDVSTMGYRFGGSTDVNYLKHEKQVKVKRGFRNLGYCFNFDSKLSKTCRL